MKTYSVKASEIKRQWFLVDAAGRTLGRLASAIAHRLKGKHKPLYSPHLDLGDYVVVINADKIAVTGNKAQGKEYHRHTGYPGGLKTRNFQQQMEHEPTSALALAVRGMMPKGVLGREMLKKLKVYAGTAHPHEAQQPEVWQVAEGK